MPKKILGFVCIMAEGARMMVGMPPAKQVLHLCTWYKECKKSKRGIINSTTASSYFCYFVVATKRCM